MFWLALVCVASVVHTLQYPYYCSAAADAACCCLARRSLQQSSGSHIMVDQNYPEGQDRMVIIKGQRDNVERAAAMINELIAGEPGSASAIIAKVSTVQSAAALWLQGVFVSGVDQALAGVVVLWR